MIDCFLAIGITVLLEKRASPATLFEDFYVFASNLVRARIQSCVCPEEYICHSFSSFYIWFGDVWNDLS